MKIISHRGWWKIASEKNGTDAFKRSIAGGFGTETDVRDLAGRLVVSHDPPRTDSMEWSKLIELFVGTKLPIAVNVKADGLAELLSSAFEGHEIPWFVFDMSAPEMVRYAAANIPFYTRHSDLEPEPIMYKEATGVWLDSFKSDWFQRDVIDRHLDAGKEVCIVSSELHGRQPDRLWEKIINTPDQVTLCTDRPDEARQVLQNDQSCNF